MAVEYTKIFRKMGKRHIICIETVRKAGFSGNILSRTGRGGCVFLEIIGAFVNALGCNVDEILKIKPEQAKEELYA